MCGLLIPLAVAAVVRLVTFTSRSLTYRIVFCAPIILVHLFWAGILALMFVGAQFHWTPIDRTKQRADTNALLQACTEVLQNPQVYTQDDYFAYKGEVSNLPSGISSLEPVRVSIFADSINVALIGGLAHAGWSFRKCDGSNWALYWYTDVEREPWISNIVVNLPEQEPE